MSSSKTWVWYFFDMNKILDWIKKGEKILYALSSAKIPL